MALLLVGLEPCTSGVMTMGLIPSRRHFSTSPSTVSGAFKALMVMEVTGGTGQAGTGCGGSAASTAACAVGTVRGNTWR